MIAAQCILAFLQSLGWPELMVIGLVALLIFGRRLPEVGRSLGKGIVEFKKGLKDTTEEVKDILPSEQEVKGGTTGPQDDQDKSEKASKPSKSSKPS